MPRCWPGFICAGTVFLLQNFGYLENIDVWDFWPVLLILLGLSHLAQPSGSRQAFSGVILVAIGGLFLLDNLNIIPYGFGDFWPVILILVGIFIIKGAVWPGIGKTATSSDFVNLSLILGGGGYKYNTKNFKGGKVSAIMGGGTIDLRGADIQEEGAILDTFAFWGGIEIKVPENWLVTVHGSPLLGGFENKAAGPVNGIANADKGVKKLLIKGTAIMGGVEVKN